MDHYRFGVISVTAYDQYGFPAVKFSAIDYLLKPLNAAELKAAVGKAQERCSQKMQNLEVET